MDGNNQLAHILADVLSIVNPSREDYSLRLRIINELENVLQSVESLRGATVDPFGSFVSNLFTRWGDLDISIELSTGSHIASTGKKYKQRLLGDILRAMVQKGGFRISNFIANAKVPILKIMSRHNVSCDISINNLSGHMKSKILYHITEIDDRFRDLVLLVKEWARAQKINDPKAGTLNSYSLSLLVIFHFQTCVPAIFPPMREIYPRNMIDDLRGVRADVEEQIKKTCERQIKKFRTNRSRKNQSSLSQLFKSFLAKFSDISLRAPSHGISIYNGQWEEIANNMPWLPKTYALFIEDPFEQPTNTARTVSNNLLNRISEAFQTTHQLLASGSWNRFSLISTLAPPHTLRYLARTPAGSQYFSCSNGFGNGPQGPREVHFARPSAGSQCFNGRNGFVNGPEGPQAVHSPKQHQAKSKGADQTNGNGPHGPRGVHSPKQHQATSTGANRPHGPRTDQSKLKGADMHQSNRTSSKFVQSCNGRSNGSSGRFFQSSNGYRAVHPLQQKIQKTRIVEHQAGPSIRPAPPSPNGHKVQTWRPKTEPEVMDSKREEKENT